MSGRKPTFEELGDCERCGKQQMISRNGICEICLDSMINLRNEPSARDARLGTLARSENGYRSANRRRMLLETCQPDSSEVLRWNRVPALEKRALNLRLPKARIKELIDATPEEIGKSREGNPCEACVAQTNDELVKWIARHPSSMYELSPQKFEELVADILRDQGYVVEITQSTRDKGRDILAVFNTPQGEILTVVECKKYRLDRKIGVSIVERFIHVIRETDKANKGLIVTTSEFSADSIKKAAEFKWLLSLSDFHTIHAMAQKYGTWLKGKDQALWLPTTKADITTKKLSS